MIYSLSSLLGVYGFPLSDEYNPSYILNNNKIIMAVGGLLK